MEANLIDLNHYAVKTTLKTLLQDKTTKKNIIWATNSYEDYGPEYKDSKQITIGTLIGLKPMTLQPRVLKKLDEQQDRTHKRAEVMTPSWLCNAMNNVCVSPKLTTSIVGLFFYACWLVFLKLRVSFKKVIQ